MDVIDHLFGSEVVLLDVAGYGSPALERIPAVQVPPFRKALAALGKKPRQIGHSIVFVTGAG
jgi:hypothetical protein